MDVAHVRSLEKSTYRTKHTVSNMKIPMPENGKVDVTILVHWIPDSRKGKPIPDQGLAIQ